jgi:hypothetical protein
VADQLNELSENKRKVDFDSFDITVKELISMVSDDILNIAPEYQRHFRWPLRNQSLFIESVFLGIPIPSLFAAANSDGTWELIDGVQRLSSLIHFAGEDKDRKKIGLSTPLRLQDLEKLPSFNGYTFAELPESIQLKFRLIGIRITTISDKSDLNVRFDLFERLNTGGISLEPQEIRNCIFRGKFADQLERLAKFAPFKRVVKIPILMQRNGTPEEFVLRFFAYLHRYTQFEHSVVEFLNDYMREANKDFDYDANERLFKSVFTKLDKALPHGIVRGQKTRSPANLYEAISVGAALALRKWRDINASKLPGLLNSAELKKFTSAGSNTKAMVKRRIEYCRDELKP